jgi:hypothetical protein
MRPILRDAAQDARLLRMTAKPLRTDAECVPRMLRSAPLFRGVVRC